METAFYIAAAVAVLATVRAVSAYNAVHALLYMVVSLLATAVIFYLLGAAFAAALTIIINAGAIMVLFVFLVMMLNLGPQSAEQESKWLGKSVWIGPCVLAMILAGEVIFIVIVQQPHNMTAGAVEPQAVGASLFGPYAIAVEAASMVLLAAMVAAFHLGRKNTRMEDEHA
jgi:NADH-quinone oxidoreductase subunit J